MDSILKTVEEHEIYMSLAIDLSRNGAGTTSPNPIVGCVIVNDGVIVGTGFHERAGGPHAEIVALSSAGAKAKEADVYVTLEPCTVKGRTPPCVEALIRAGVSKVFVAVLDPNPDVNGSGIRALKNADIEVKTGILTEKAAFLNRYYLTYRKAKRPYITLKVATSLDGRIADFSGNSKWITSSKARSLVQELRRVHDAVLVGAETIRKDNPLLSYRGERPKIPPLKRVIISKSGNISTKSRVFTNANKFPTYLFTSKNSNTHFPSDVNIITLKSFQIPDLLKEIMNIQITSLLVEGGSEVFTQFLKDNLYDEIVWFIAPKLIGKGKMAFSWQEGFAISGTPTLNLKRIERIEDDVVLFLYPKEKSWI